MPRSSGGTRGGHPAPAWTSRLSGCSRKLRAGSCSCPPWWGLSVLPCTPPSPWPTLPAFPYSACQLFLPVSLRGCAVRGKTLWLVNSSWKTPVSPDKPPLHKRGVMGSDMGSLRGLGKTAMLRGSQRVSQAQDGGDGTISRGPTCHQGEHLAVWGLPLAPDNKGTLPVSAAKCSEVELDGY